MTKEEAVLRLETLKDFSQNNELKNMHEAIDMAIKALEEQSDEIILHNDKVIIEPSLYLKPQALHENVELILKQMESGDVTVLPPGFTAKIVRRDVVLKGTKGETDDN